VLPVPARSNRARFRLSGGHAVAYLHPLRFSGRTLLLNLNEQPSPHSKQNASSLGNVLTKRDKRGAPVLRSSPRHITCARNVGRLPATRCHPSSEIFHKETPTEPHWALRVGKARRLLPSWRLLRGAPHPPRGDASIAQGRFASPRRSALSLCMFPCLSHYRRLSTPLGIARERAFPGVATLRLNNLVGLHGEKGRHIGRALLQARARGAAPGPRKGAELHDDSVERVQVSIAGFCEYEQGLWRRTTELTHYLPNRWCA
jgi:hypothetical protein